MSRRIRALLAVLVTGAAVAVALPSSAQAAIATPKVGQCHQLSFGQTALDADTKQPVPCSKRHNLVTVGVATSPTSLAGTTLDERQKLGLDLCLPKVNKVLGRSAATRAMSAYTVVYFSPSADQIAAGARWFRCDVALQAGNRFKPLPKRVHRPVLPRRLSDDVRRCLTRSATTTVCSSRHTYRSISAFRMRSSASVPTDDEFITAASRACQQDWRYATWPGPNAWAAGERMVVCYAKTKK